MSFTPSFTPSPGKFDQGTESGGAPDPFAFGNALDLDGNNDVVNADALVSDLASDTAGTWVLWVKPTDSTPSGTEIILSPGDTDALTRISLFYLATGILKVQVTVANSNKWALETDSAPFTSGVWTQVALVQNGTAAVLYIDAVAVDQTFSISLDKTTWFSDMPGLDNVRFGSLKWNSGGDVAHYAGVLDELGFWNSALTSGEITALYNLGAGLDYLVDGGDYVSSDDLVSWYRLNSSTGTTALDSKGTNNGTLENFADPDSNWIAH